MCRDFREGDSVVVNYPNGPSKAGSVVQRNEDGTWKILFEDTETGAETCDPKVQESWMEIPGQFLEQTASA